jgi:hypothetical protein
VGVDRARPVGRNTSRRTGATWCTYCAWLRARGRHRSTWSPRTSSGSSATSWIRRGGRHGGPSARRGPLLHRYLAIEQVRPDDPTSLEGVRVPSGIPKPLSEARWLRCSTRCVGTDPLARVATGRCSSCCTPPGRGSRRWSGLSIGDSTSTTAGAVVRQGGQGAHRPLRAGGGPAVDEWFEPAGRPRLVPRPVATPRRRRGRVPEPARRARLSRQGPRRSSRSTGSGQASPSTSPRTCCATRARRTCSTTGPTCGSCRRCSATPRSRRRRCTPR